MSRNIEEEKIARPELAEHDSKVLDLAFAMDCTASMGSYIEDAQQNIRNIVEEIVASEKSDIRMALVEYRDHPPQDSSFVTRTHDFTSSASKMKSWLSDCSAEGGGDGPEAVADALHDVVKLSWRDEATKICVCISDAPPHGLGACGDGFPNGCPDGIDPMVVSQTMAEKGITLYVVGCEPSISPYKDFFMAIAYMTGGQYVPLGKSNLLSKVIIGGALEEMSIEQLMGDVNEEVAGEMEAGREIDMEEFSKRVHENLKKKGVKTKQLRRNRAELAAPSKSAVSLSVYTNMEDVRKNFTPVEVGNFTPVEVDLDVDISMERSDSSSRKTKSRGGPASFFRSVVPSFMKKKSRARKRETSETAVPEMVAERCSFNSDDSGGYNGCGGESYDVVESGPSYAQAQRMVQKSVARNYAKKKSM